MSDDASVKTSPAMRLAEAKRRRPVTTPRPTPKTVWVCNLKEQRNRTGLSIREVAKAVGLSVSGYWQIEHGSDPMLTTAARIARFFDVPVEWLWPNEAVNGGSNHNVPT